MDYLLMYDNQNSDLPNSKSDLYNVAKMLYSMLADTLRLTIYIPQEVPLDAESISNEMEGIPQLLRDLIMKAINHQFKSAQEMQSTLRETMQDDEVLKWLENQEVSRQPKEEPLQESPPLETTTPRRRRWYWPW